MAKATPGAPRCGAGMGKKGRCPNPAVWRYSGHPRRPPMNRCEDHRPVWSYERERLTEEYCAELRSARVPSESPK